MVALWMSKVLQNAPRGSILQYFWPALSNNRSWKPVLAFFLSDRWTQGLLYAKSRQSKGPGQPVYFHWLISIYYWLLAPKMSKYLYTPHKSRNIYIPHKSQSFILPIQVKKNNFRTKVLISIWIMSPLLCFQGWSDPRFSFIKQL